MDKDALLSLVTEQYDIGEQAVTPVRSEFEREDRIFHDQRQSQEVITDYSFYVVHSAFMARTYVDKVKASFRSIKPGIVSKSVVDNLNYALEKDMSTLDWERVSYQKNYDKYKYGVGIIAKVGWDGSTKSNKWHVIDPKSVIVDPDGDYVTDDYDFFGYNSFLSMEEMPQEWTGTENLVSHKGDIGYDTLRDSAIQNAGISKHHENDNLFQIYTHFSYVEDKLCMSVWGNERKECLFYKFFEGVFPDEQENKRNVQISDYIACDRWRPMRESFFGHRLAKFAGNIQEQKALLASLRYKKSKSELYPMYLYNSRLIKNREDLDFGFNKYIAVNALEGEDIGNAVKPLNKDFRADNSRLMEDDLDSQLTRVTGGMNGSIIQGDETGRRETLGTNKIVQGNANINLQLTSFVSLWFEKQIVRNWLRGYLENFKSGDSKIVKIESIAGIEYKTLTKKDFLDVLEVDIEVETQSMRDDRENEERVALTQTFTVISSMDMPTVSKHYTLREIARRSKIQPHMVDVIVPYSPQEIRALEENRILTGGRLIHIREDDDHITHIITHKLNGTDNLEIATHLQEHIEAYIQTQPPQQEQPQGMSQGDQNAQNLQQNMLGQQLAQADAVNNGGLGVRM